MTTRGVGTRPRGSLRERWERKVNRQGPRCPGLPGRCWIWTGGDDGKDYGHIVAEPPSRRKLKAHRVAYELFVGPIPEGLEIDHLCRRTLCVNPLHLEPVTHAENIDRAPRSAITLKREQTVCREGHPLVVCRDQRRCVICRRRQIREAQRRYVQRQKERALCS